MKSPGGLSYITREDTDARMPNPIGERPKIFISYKKKEVIRSEDDSKRLESARDFAARKLIDIFDCAVWHDGNLTAGEDYNDEIRKAISECDAMVLLLTANVLDSRYIWETEVQLAADMNKIIIPVALDFPSTKYQVVETRLNQPMHIISWPGSSESSSQSETEFNESLVRALEQLEASNTLSREIAKISTLIEENVPLSELTLNSWYLIGCACLTGNGIRQDAERGSNLLRAVMSVSCEDEDVLSLRRQAANALFEYHYQRYSKNKSSDDFALVKEYSKIGVKLGDSELTYRRGNMHRKGRGAGRDPLKAMELYERAAELGNPRAIAALGAMLRAGEGTAPDAAGAFKLLSTAAQQGNGEAMGHLAEMYDKGEGCEINRAEAEKWYIRAAEANGGYAMRKLGERYYSDGDYESAYNWYFKSAARGDGIAMRTLGDMYRRGTYVPVNYDEAYKWYFNSASVGNYVAMRELGELYAKGTGVEKSLANASRWFREYVEFGGARAAGALGRMYYTGDDLPQDNSLAAYWYSVAADKGSEEAAAFLHRLLEAGVTVTDPFAVRVTEDKPQPAMPREETAAVPQVEAPPIPVLSRKEQKAALKARRAEEKKEKKAEKAALRLAAKQARKSSSR